MCALYEPTAPAIFPRISVPWIAFTCISRTRNHGGLAGNGMVRMVGTVTEPRWHLHPQPMHHIGDFLANGGWSGRLMHGDGRHR